MENGARHHRRPLDDPDPSRFLLNRTRRFQDLSNAFPGLTPSVLSARLKELEEEDAIESRLYSDHPPRAEYRLTDRGRSLGPILKALRQWGEAHTAPE